MISQDVTCFLAFCFAPLLIELDVLELGAGIALRKTTMPPQFEIWVLCSPDFVEVRIGAPNELPDRTLTPAIQTAVVGILTTADPVVLNSLHVHVVDEPPCRKWQ